MEKVGVVVDRILDYLCDNQCGDIGEITKITGLGVDEVGAILGFLEKFDLVCRDPESGGMRLTDSSKKLVSLE